MMSNHSKCLSGYFTQQRNEMLKYFPTKGSVALEVGCGAGTFGSLLAEKKGFSVWGIEMSPSAGSKATSLLQGIFIGSFDEFWVCFNNKRENINNNEIFDKTYDYIIFNDVLEHFADPWDVLIKCKTLLNSEGRIVASIPNVRYYKNIKKLLIQKDWQYTKKGILDRTHLRFFTKKSIARMFEECGYQTSVLKGLNRTPKKGPTFVNALLMNFIEDMLYTQFAVVAKVISG